MPRDSAYAEGIALDIKEQFELSAARYRDADAAFGKARPAPGRSAATLAAWQRKSRWQFYWLQQLALRRGRHIYGGPVAAELGQACLLKFLAARAFTGKPPLGLARRARELLEDALRQEPGSVTARLSLATLLQEVASRCAPGWSSSGPPSGPPPARTR